VSTPSRKRKLQVQAALATRKQHCSSGGVINTVVVITINIHVKGIGGVSAEPELASRGTQADVPEGNTNSGGGS
jgi:hypothetical protein